MRKFNFTIFFIFTFLLIIIAFFASDMALSRDEGKLGKNIVLNFLADFYNILRFPAHTLFPEKAKQPLFFSLGLLVNCMLYGILIERIFYFTIKLIFYRHNSDEA